jgi:tetratricopeptide (TPR) repeat protein
VKITGIEDLVVEILLHTAHGPGAGWRVGSGFLVDKGLVLTAAHNVGAGDLTVRVKDVEYAATVRLTGDQKVDIALIKIDGYEVEAPGIRYGEVDRASTADITDCWAIGFPAFREYDSEGGGKPRRTSEHVSGRIPNGSNLGQPRLNLQVGASPWADPHASRSGYGRDSQWAGMSGAAVFTDDSVLLGVVSDHHLPAGASALDVVPIAAINELPNRAEWWSALGGTGTDLVRVPYRDDGDLGLERWTADDFAAGSAAGEPSSTTNPIEGNERPGVEAIRRGRLPGLQCEFRGLAEVFDEWLTVSEQRKRGDDMLRVFWIESEPTPHRAKALLACLSRGGINGRPVYDAHRDLGRAADGLRASLQRRFPPRTSLIGADIESGDDLSRIWNSIREHVEEARRLIDFGHPARGVDPYPRLIVAGTGAQRWAAHRAASDYVIIDAFDVNGLPRRRSRSFSPGGDDVANVLPGYEDVYNRGLPMTARKLFGRRHELETLREAWTAEDPRVLSVVASGGTGKSALINAWLRDMQESGYGGAEKVLAWSFYSQGTKDNLVSADPFINFALQWLGDPEAVPLPPITKGTRLANMIKKKRFLLVLDGLEPLQHPLTARNVGGRLTDDSMRALLEELAKPDWNGLCLVTTRVPVTDLEVEEFEGHAERLDLDNLDTGDAIDLLRERTGNPGTSGKELRAAVTDVQCHALAVTLLGNYIRDVKGGDIRGRADLEALMVDVHEGGHARRIMASYVRWLQGVNSMAELAILDVIGLFDRPAEVEALNALLDDAEIVPYSAGLDHVGGARWNACVDGLRKMGLLTAEIPDSPGAIDAHPLVREHFRDVARTRRAGFWERGNRVLFDYFQKKVPVRRPDDNASMSILYAAVTHGSAAGLHQAVFDDVLLPRIWHDRRTIYSTRRLGMTGTDLVALSNYFDHRQWTELYDLPLTTTAQVLIRTNAGVRLRQLGRLPEARRCFGKVVDVISPDTATPEQLDDASYASAQYCELLVIAGRLTGDEGENDTALAAASRAVSLSAKGGEAYFRMHALSSQAEVYFMLGNLAGSDEYFERARRIDRDQKPKPPFLYSQGLFRYGYYLIETGRADEVLAGERADPDWGRNGEDSSLLSRAIRSLVLGAAHRALVEAGRRELAVQAERILDDSINEFRAAGYADYLVRGLLERAHFYRACRRADDFGRAMADLDKAARHAKSGEMDLLYADILLQRSACYLDFWPVMGTSQREECQSKIVDALRGAVALVRETHYHRRMDALRDLAAEAAGFGIPI